MIAIFLIPNTVNACLKTNTAFKKDELTFDFEWVKDYTKKYQELGWFENHSFLGRNIQKESLVFFYSDMNQKEFNPFEKLVFMLYHLRLFIQAPHSEFQQMALFQAPSLKLDYQAFYSIKNEIFEALEFRENLDQKQLRKLLELTLIYSQIHLSQNAQTIADIYDIKIDKDLDFFSTIRDSLLSFFPSYENLNSEEKTLLEKLLKFSKFDNLFCLNLQNKDRLLHGDQKEYANDENLFDLIFFLYRCYCPGAHCLSLHQDFFYHKKLHLALEDIKQAFIVMQSGGVEAGIEHFIDKKRALFSINPTSIIDLVLEPIFLKLYFLEKEDLYCFKKQVVDLKPEHLSLLITYLKDDCFESVSFLSKIIKAIYEQKESQLTKEVFQDSLDLFVKVLVTLEQDVHVKNSIKVLDDAYLIKALRSNSGKLLAKEIKVDRQGVVRLQINK